MPKIAEYQVVTFIGTGELHAKVAELMSTGWQPHGGVSTTAAFGEFAGKGVVIYSQAMIKPEAIKL